MVNKQKHGLGNSLSALIPKELNTAALLETGERIHKLALDIIEPDKDQPRRHFDPQELKELADSIKTHGVIQPIVVSPKGLKYQLVAGERRWRAAQLARAKTIPAVVRTLKDLERLEVAMIENVQRVDLSPIEQALSIEKLHHQFNLSYPLIATKLGKAISTVNNMVRLLQLPPEALEALNNKIITEGHARSILALKEFPDHQAHLLAECMNGWSVRQAERYVASIKKAGVSDTIEAKARVSLETAETKALGSRLGTTVNLRRMASGGRLEIVFENDEQLNKIIEMIS